MHPLVVITIDGQPVSGFFMSRLIDVTVTDREGERSDTVDLSVEAGPPGIAVPRSKAIITSAFGYRETGVSSFGAFTADEVTLNFFPTTLKIQGKSADMRASLKEQRDKHWDDADVNTVVNDIAGEHGLSAQVDPSVGSLKYDWLGQMNESGLHFLHRLAQRSNALFAIKDGKLIFSKKGSGFTASGVAMGGLVVTPEMIIGSSGSVTFSEREGHQKVRAPYHDSEAAERKFEEAPGNPQAEAEAMTLRHQFANKDEAKAAAESKAKELQRNAASASVDIEGNVAARAGAPMSFGNVHPSVDGVQFIIEEAAHKYSKAGYTTSIKAKLKV